MRAFDFPWHTLAILITTGLSLSACGEETAALPAQPQMGDIQRLVFNRSCIDAGCHDSATRAGALDLSTTAISREQLLGRPPDNSAAIASGWTLVAPGNPDESFLVRKLDQPGLGEGAGMPIGYRLTEDYMALVIRWIEAGSP